MGAAREPAAGPPPITYAQANLLQRTLRRLGASRPGAWVFARVLHRVDRPVHRLTRGRHTFTSLLAGIPVVMLTTTGARSGVARTVPVLGLPTDDGLVVIASSFGRTSHPAWHHNLRANPDAVVTVGGAQRAVRAVAAGGERRARIWREGLTVYPGWSQYERRAAHREIVVYVLEPRRD
ncbi:MAG: nitroreductase family deazaflavin-dependent oxidoreductase [Solirubrobacteraceae bacterium]